MKNEQKDYYEQIDQSISILQSEVERKDLTPFESYCTAIGELNDNEGHSYQLQMRIVRMDCKLASEENGYWKEEIVKFHK